MSETAVERRLREMSKKLERFDPVDALDIDAGREALELLREWIAAVTIPSDDGEVCNAHGEETDLCDACLYESQKRRRTAADHTRALLARCEGE